MIVRPRWSLLESLFVSLGFTIIMAGSVFFIPAGLKPLMEGYVLVALSAAYILACVIALGALLISIGLWLMERRHLKQAACADGPS